MTPKLSDYFQPLNFFTLLYFIAFVLFFDIFGSFIKKFFIKDNGILSDTKLIDWLVGLGLFVFVWFLLGFFILPTQTAILISMGFVLAISLPDYWRNKSYLKYLSLLKQLILPAILLLPFLPPTFIKASLPPYYSDEMAYHFISPYSLMHQLKIFWTFNGGALMNAPRMMDIFYILGFSVTHTYSVVRLLQFSVLATSILLAYQFLKKYFGLIPSFIFVLMFLSLPLDLPFTATLGYVDVPAYSFMLIGLVFGLAFFMSDNTSFWVLSFIFWGMSIGTKYPTFMAFTVFLASFVFVYFLKKRSLKVFLNKGLIIKLIMGIVVFGGYWYIKNFAVYGNPIYPFFFPCWGKYALDCGTGASFFGTWTTPVTLNTIIPIITELIPKNRVLHYMLLVSPVLVLFSKDQKAKLILLMMALFFGMELLVLKYFSGFEVRYHQHLQFILMISIVLFSAVGYRTRILSAFKYLAIIAVVASCLFYYAKNVGHLNSLNFVNWHEIDYSLGRTNIYDWIKWRLPRIAEAVEWCENPPGGPVGLARLDPDMIWFEDEGFMRSFLLNCYYENPDMGSATTENFIEKSKENKLQFWIASVNPCIPQDQVKMKRKEEDGGLLDMRKINNVIICNSREVFPNFYYFNYQTLK